MKNPIIHLYSVCFNEQVLMPHFLNYYINFCDKLFIYDNQSSDNTVKICQEFENVEVLQFETSNKIRDDIFLNIKNNIWKKSRGIADLVIVCDIDEFLYINNIKEELSKIFVEGVTIIKSIGFNMVSSELPNDEDNLLSKFKFGTRSSSFDKVILFDPNKIDEINFDFGAHICNPVGLIKYSNSEFKLLHYKYLNLDYLISRYQLMSSRLSNFNKKLNLSIHYAYSKRKISREFENINNSKMNVFEI